MQDWEFCRKPDCPERNAAGVPRDRLLTRQWLRSQKKDTLKMLAMRSLLRREGQEAARLPDDAVIDRIAGLMASGALHVHTRLSGVSGARAKSPAAAGSAPDDEDADPDSIKPAPDKDDDTEDDPAAASISCNVTVSPGVIKICNTKTHKELRATGTPAGGTFSWSSADPSIAKVTGSTLKGDVVGAKAGKTRAKVTYSVSGCTCSAEAEIRICTCTPAPHDGRHYTTAHKDLADAIGVRAKIKTRYGKVCCEDEGCSTLDSYNVVYANVSHEKGGLIWAQTGFGRERNSGTTAVHKYRYAEMNGSSYKVKYDTANPPAEGDVHLYQCQLDNTTGKWHYSQDGTEWQIFADPRWKKKTGESIQYTGEIIDQEDDMAGTEGDKCEITECQFLLQQKSAVEEKTPSQVLSDFGFDKSTVTPEQQAQLDTVADQVAASWKTPPEIVKIRLVGHTDAVGSPGYNIGLGQRRALASRSALVDALEARETGLSGKVKFVTESKGETQLIDNSGSEAGNALNRRVEVFLTANVPEDWQDAGLTEDDVSSDDDSEWGAEWVSGTALNIWDKQPIS